MFKKVLVANRGEVAVQIIRALHEMNIKAVAVYSTADADSLFVKLADESVCIGGPFPDESYLNMAAIIDSAVLCGCDALHPGYGFLSENADFAELCEQCGIKFIGPSAKVINLMGNKGNAKEAMRQNGVPTIPGSDGFVDTYKQAKEVAKETGYPIMLKAAAGGGGKGIRKVLNEAELRKAFTDTKREAKLSFGDDRLYMEKDLSDAKHIEMQVIADEHGHVIYFPERDCSMQRNHQKVIEESPCSQITEQKRQELGQIVVKAAKGIGYTNTGTFEFLMDQDHNFYFMEMNTRLQVEYTITEEVTGVEIIKAQIMVAQGQELPFTQADCAVNGYSIECRINAEDPSNNFTPSPGKLEQMKFPDESDSIRIDSGVEAGDMISPYYDSMIAKIIVHKPTKREAVSKMKRILTNFVVEGVTTNRDFLIDLISDRHFLAGDFNNNYIESTFLKEWMKQYDKQTVWKD